jgi:hypothetical protein
MDSARGRQFKAFPRALQSALGSYAKSGGNLFVSGAYVGTDLRDSIDIAFAKEVLHYRLSTGFASRTGRVLPTRDGSFTDTLAISFATEPTESLYGVEAPDGLTPTDGGVAALRYSDSMTGAGLAWKGSSRVFVLGFPFETVTEEAQRAILMHEILGFFRR